MKGILHIDKMGHTGTLDVDATGLLVCLMGNATKYQDYFKDEKKVYEGELVFGLSTDTDDIHGKILKEADVNITADNTASNTTNNINRSQLENTIKNFIGDIDQIPPMYSSKKVDGKKLISLARKGEVIEREASKIKIFNIDLINDFYEKEVNGKKYKTIKIKVECSKGTYIRSLCRDIGDALSVPASMGELRRLQSDGFNIKNAHTLDEIKEKVSKGDYSFIRIALYNKCPQVVTFGKYDCLHIGHKKIIDRVVEEAKTRNIESSVLTFSINPKVILDKDGDKIVNIISKEQRVSYLKLYGIDNILEFPFNEMTKDIDGETFIREILVNQMKAKAIVVGDDCSFGKKGAYKVKELKEICKALNIDLIVIDRVKISEVISDTNVEKSQVISSTYIRELIKDGKIEEAEKLAGHHV